jgi:callose synthase
MDYLQAQYGPQWENALERLGAADETTAWAATHDADGQPVDGELELCFWASHRGQTLARCAFGVMEYSRALALLAEIELEREYVALEVASYVHAVGWPPVLPSATLQRIRADAAAAAQWWVDARFSLTMACQRYGEQGTPADMAKRKQVDVLMSRYGPRLRVAYFDKVTVPSKPQPQPSLAAQGALVGAAAGSSVVPVHSPASTNAANSAALMIPVTRWYSVSLPASAATHVLMRRHRL